MEALREIRHFLRCDTPSEWIQAALQQQETLLIDHANCEKKAARTALNLMFRYIEYPNLLKKMSRLAREELRHFEQVHAILCTRKIPYRMVQAARYADGMRKHIRTHEPVRLIDTMIVGAFIEARSCERFSCIAPQLDDELRDFYLSLLRSEARHYAHYLGLAKEVSREPLDDRIAFFAEIEAEFIQAPDQSFRFHSGLPAWEGAPTPLVESPVSSAKS